MFNTLGLSDDIVDAITEMGYKEATPVQSQSIPIILQGHDLMAFAQTGTGKTAAFLLPMLDKILDQKQDKVKGLIIAPTRELAAQIDQQLEGMAYYTDINSLAIYGGGDGIDFSQEKKALMQGTDIIIATPGRLMSHLKMGYVDFSQLMFLVLDEADKMLDMGFLPDILNINKHLPKQRQSLMFSATMNKKIKDMAKQLLNNAKEVSIAIAKPAAGIVQAAYLIHDKDKIRLLDELLKDKKDEKMIIFAGSKLSVDAIAKALKKLPLGSHAFHSGFEQREREHIMRRFRSGEIKILVATDIVSRGIDINDIDLIINYDIPGDAEDYVHRIGRTARAERSGLAISFINKKDVSRFQQIEKLIEREVHKIALPAGYSAPPSYGKEAKAPSFHKKGRPGHHNKKHRNSKGKSKPQTHKPKR